MFAPSDLRWLRILFSTILIWRWTSWMGVIAMSRLGRAIQSLVGKKDLENGSAATSAGWDEPYHGHGQGGKGDERANGNHVTSISGLSANSSSSVPGPFMDNKDEGEEEVVEVGLARARRSHRTHHTSPTQSVQSTRKTRVSRKRTAPTTSNVPGSSRPSNHQTQVTTKDIRWHEERCPWVHVRCRR